MARSIVLVAKTTNTRKRKSTGGVDDGKPGAEANNNKRRRTLDTFFSPQVSIPSLAGKDADTPYEHVSLNAEQVRVLHMVVQEEKSVFFTGAAGMPIYEPASRSCYVLSLQLFAGNTRRSLKSCP
ncbi:hypothetical protein C8Q77DRAFT_769366 [Trametes polyzona]|nr:hypothetical protein C8Q77DRAFT_769366 [Trametes polyzona]